MVATVRVPVDVWQDPETGGWGAATEHPGVIVVGYDSREDALQELAKGIALALEGGEDDGLEVEIVAA